MKRFLLTAIAAIGLLLPNKAEASISVLAPDSPHVTFNFIPLSSAAGSGRYQQVYGTGNFSSAITINSIAFSPGSDGIFDGNISIRLGTTTVAVGALDTTLDNNVTSGLTNVFTDATFSQAVVGGSETFSLVFNLTTSFHYDPSSGENLLLDILFSGSTYGDGMSRAALDTGLTSRAWDNTGFGNEADNAGLRTLFGGTVIPEPGTLAIWGVLGLTGLGLYRRKS